MNPHRETLFTSDRERRLWAWTLVVVLGIYATLGVAPALAGFLRETGLMEIGFSASLFLIGAAVVAQALRTRPGAAEIGVGLGVTAVYLLLFLRLNSPEERSHLIEYSVVGLLVYEALTERGRARHVPVPALLAIGLTTLIGVIDECIQLQLPGRVFDPVDILFDFLAAVAAVGGVKTLRWARGWRRGGGPRPPSEGPGT